MDKDNTNSYKDMTVRVYDDSQPIHLEATLRDYSIRDCKAEWRFELWDSINKQYLLKCGLNELIALLLLGKVQKDALEANILATSEVK